MGRPIGLCTSCSRQDFASTRAQIRRAPLVERSEHGTALDSGELERVFLQRTRHAPGDTGAERRSAQGERADHVPRDVLLLDDAEVGLRQLPAQRADVFVARTATVDEGPVGAAEVGQEEDAVRLQDAADLCEKPRYIRVAVRGFDQLRTASKASAG